MLDTQQIDDFNYTLLDNFSRFALSLKRECDILASCQMRIESVKLEYKSNISFAGV